MQAKKTINREQPKTVLFKPLSRIGALVALPIAALTANVVMAQQQEGKAIQVIAPVGAGGATDVIVRSMLPAMNK